MLSVSQTLLGPKLRVQLNLPHKIIHKIKFKQNFLCTRNESQGQNQIACDVYF